MVWYCIVQNNTYLVQITLNICRGFLMNDWMLCNLMSEYLGLVYRSVGGVQLHVCTSLKDSVVCSYMSAYYWRTQWCAVTRLHVTEGPSGVKLHVYTSLKDPVKWSYMSACHWRTHWSFPHLEMTPELSLCRLTRSDIWTGLLDFKFIRVSWNFV